MRIESVRLNKAASGGVIVNGVRDVTLAAEHTWELTCHRGDPDIFNRHLSVLWESGHNTTRVWPWWGPNDYNDARRPLRPLAPSEDYLERMASNVKDYLDAGIVPMVILFRANESGVPFRTYEEDETIGAADIIYLERTIQALGTEPIIWEVGNEMPRGSGKFQESVILYLRSSDPHNRPIVVNTGFGSSGMTWERLDALKANGIALIPDAGATSKVKIWDTDHLRSLQETNGAKKVGQLRQAHADGARILLNMMAFETSRLNGGTNAHDPNNPSIVLMREAIGRLATPLPGGKFYAQEEPPAPPVQPAVEAPEPPTAPPTAPPETKPKRQSYKKGIREIRAIYGLRPGTENDMTPLDRSTATKEVLKRTRT